jgi:hypothetical protein
VTSSLKAQQRIGATERKRNSCSIGGRERARERQNRLIKGCRSEPFGRIHSHYAASPEAMMSHRDGAVSGGATAFGYRPAFSTRWGLRDALAKLGSAQMRSKSQTAWETAARCAMLAQEAYDQEEREYYVRLVMRGPRWRKDARISTSLMSRRNSSRRH